MLTWHHASTPWSIDRSAMTGLSGGASVEPGVTRVHPAGPAGNAAEAASVSPALTVFSASPGSRGMVSLCRHGLPDHDAALVFLQRVEQGAAGAGGQEVLVGVVGGSLQALDAGRRTA